VRLRPISTRERTPKLHSPLSFLEPLWRLITIASNALFSNWWHLGMAGRLPEYLCPAECVGQQDFVGLDYYWGISTLRLARISRLFNALAGGQLQQAPVFARGLFDQLVYHAKLFPKLPIIVVENGSIDYADGVDRATYLRTHIREVQRAAAQGIRVVAYLCWSITSNREWGLAFGPNSDFGLYHVELDTDPTLRRQSTAAASAFREVIRARGAD